MIVGIKYSISSKNFFDLHSFAFPTQSQHMKTKQQKEAPKSVGLLGWLFKYLIFLFLKY